MLGVPVKADSLNEKWLFIDAVTADDGQVWEEKLEIAFTPAGGFSMQGRHVNDWISYAEGRYHYQEATGEIFVFVASGGYEWPNQGGEKWEKLYYAVLFNDYPLYFQIADRSESQVTVTEYINFYSSDYNGKTEDLCNTEPVWREANGVYGLIPEKTLSLRQRTYTVE